MTTFVEPVEHVDVLRVKLTSRVCWWAIEQLRHDHASINGIRCQPGTGWWRTV